MVLEAKLADCGEFQWWRAEELWKTLTLGLRLREKEKINRSSLKTSTYTRVWYDWNSKNRPSSVLIALIGNVLITYMIYYISSTWNFAARRRLTYHTPRTLLIFTAESDVRFYTFTRHESELKVRRQYFCFVLFVFLFSSRKSLDRDVLTNEKTNKYVTVLTGVAATFSKPQKIPFWFLYFLSAVVLVVNAKFF